MAAAEQESYFNCKPKNHKRLAAHLANYGLTHCFRAGVPADVAIENIKMRRGLEDRLCVDVRYISSVTTLATTSAPAHTTSRLSHALRRIARPNLA